MKKPFARFRRDFLHPIFYKAVARAAVVAVIMLVWERVVSDGHITIWQGPGLLCGVALLGWAWLGYLSLDGLSVHHLLEGRNKNRRKKRPHPTASIVDYADEHIVSYEELEPEQRTYCSLLANLLLGVPLTVIGIVTGML